MQSARHLSSALSCLISCAILTLTAAGCEVFSARPGSFDSTGKKLPPLTPAPDAIEVEILYAERPVGDRLLGAELWRDVDQILSLGPELIRDLERNGFRIGVAGSNPPEALQKLIGLNSSDSKEIQGKRVYFRSGTEMQVQTSPIYLDCDMTIYPTHTSEVGEKKQYQSAQCFFRVTANRVQDGWARLEFTPEILHGIEKPRVNPGDQDWDMISSKIREPLHAQRFSVMLNVGEFAMVTARDNVPGTVGHRFFVGPEGDDGIQRILIIRLSRMGRPETPAGP